MWHVKFKEILDVFGKVIAKHLKRRVDAQKLILATNGSRYTTLGINFITVKKVWKSYKQIFIPFLFFLRITYQ